MQPTATLVAYLHTCHRKLWLHAHGIRMEHTSDLVAEDKLIGETAYDRRPDKYMQIELDGIKIDHYDPRGDSRRNTLRFTIAAIVPFGIETFSGILQSGHLHRAAIVPFGIETFAPLISPVMHRSRNRTFWN